VVMGGGLKPTLFRRRGGGRWAEAHPIQCG